MSGECQSHLAFRGAWGSQKWDCSRVLSFRRAHWNCITLLRTVSTWVSCVSRDGDPTASHCLTSLLWRVFLYAWQEFPVLQLVAFSLPFTVQRAVWFSLYNLLLQDSNKIPSLAAFSRLTFPGQTNAALSASLCTPCAAVPSHLGGTCSALAAPCTGDPETVWCSRYSLPSADQDLLKVILCG